MQPSLLGPIATASKPANGHTRSTGAVRGQPGETWNAINACLVKGLRGLPGGMTLAGLFSAERGHRTPASLCALDEQLILKLADAHHARTGTWPTRDSGPIPELPGDKWKTVHDALHKGARTLPGGSTLARLLVDSGRKSTPKLSVRLSIDLILKWGQAHRREIGRFPTALSGPVLDAPRENWSAIAAALEYGNRGLPGGLSLPGLWLQFFGRRSPIYPPPLDHAAILKWADEHYRRTGSWPTNRSAPVHSVPGENWANIDNSLRVGRRGLPGGETLARLLDRERWQLRPGRGRQLRRRR